MDMWKPYEQVLRKYADDADKKIVFDRFHIVANMNKALDQVRVLGPDRIQDFIGLLAQTDLELRGARAWPPWWAGLGCASPSTA